MAAPDYPPYHIFICPECDKLCEMSKDDFIAHLKDVHEIAEPKGKRTLMMHMSRKPRHCASYEWTIADKTFYEYRG